VRQAARRITQFYDRYLVAAGLRTTQYGILAKLKRRGAMTINTLAAELANLSWIVQRLAAISVPSNATAWSWLSQIPPTDAAKCCASPGLATPAFSGLHKGWAEAQRRFERAYGGKKASELREKLRDVIASELVPLDTLATE
jgi:hypothetical protein